MALLQKMICNLRHHMGLRHPVPRNTLQHPATYCTWRAMNSETLLPTEHTMQHPVWPWNTLHMASQHTPQQPTTPCNILQRSSLNASRVRRLTSQLNTPCNKPATHCNTVHLMGREFRDLPPNWTPPATTRNTLQHCALDEFKIQRRTSQLNTPRAALSISSNNDTISCIPSPPLPSCSSVSICRIYTYKYIYIYIRIYICI